MGPSSVSGCRSKDNLVDYLRSRARWGSDYTIVSATVKGDRHWYRARRKSDGVEFVGVDLLYKATSTDPDWGYKPMDESSHPAYYDCPVTYLKGLPAPINDYAKSWRLKVMEEHALHVAVGKNKKVIDVGEVVTIFGKEYKLRENLGRKGWTVEAVDGKHYRMTVKQLNQASTEKVVNAAARTAT